RAHSGNCGRVWICGYLDRDRLLNWSRQDRQIAEAIVFALVVDLLARGGEAHDFDRFLHSTHPALRLNSQRFELLVKQPAARLRLTFAGDEDGAAVGHEIEAAPLVREDQRIAQWGGSEASRPQLDPPGPRRER